ncbi:NAD(P)-dependent oxidoreductase [Marinobacteraceae bacterium S3BR75-40.1]
MERSPVFVTGAGGFIGRRLVRSLARDGHPVTALLMEAEPPAPDWPADVTLERGDVTRIETLRASIPEGARIVHLAAMVGDWGEPQAHHRVTVQGTENLLAVAVEKKAEHLVLSSSIVVYGHHIGSGPLDESHPFGDPLAPYDRCKQAQETLFVNYARNADIPYTVIRPANVFGPGSGPWVLSLLEEMKRGTPTLVGGGEFDAGLVYVDNLVDLFKRALERSEARNKTFIGADGFGVTWRQYMEDLASLAQVPPPKSVPDWLARGSAPVMNWLWQLVGAERRPPITPLAYRLVGQPNEFSNQKAREQLGWEPAISYRMALSAIADSLTP